MTRSRKKIVKRISLTAAAVLLSGIIVYACLVTVPYSGEKKVSQRFAEQFDPAVFYHGDSAGRVTLLDDGLTAFQYRLTLTESARGTLEFSSFSIEDGLAARVFAGALLRAADRGVKVRIVLDGKYGGFDGGQVPARALFAHPGVELYRYNALNLLRPTQINSALHDKYLVVDGENMIFGGRNVGDRYYFESEHKQGFTYDREVYVAGSSAAQSVRQYFEEVIACKASRRDTEVLSDKKRKKAELTQNSLKADAERYISENPIDSSLLRGDIAASNVTLVTNPIALGKKEPLIGYTLYRLATQSEKVFIQSPYCVLSKSHFAKFKDMCEGREVTLLTNSLASTPNLPAFSNYVNNRKKYAALEADVYEYQSESSSIHSKTFIFDDCLTAVGSFNMDERSLHLSTESMLIINGKEFAAYSEKIIDDYMDRSLRVRKDGKSYEPGAVAPAKVPFFKNLGYRIVGFVLQPFKFML